MLRGKLKTSLQLLNMDSDGSFIIEVPPGKSERSGH